MITAEFLDLLSKFDLIIRKRITSNYSGARLSTAHGRGVVIKDRRIYAPGDDFRVIDWRAYARTDKLYVKKYEEERSLSVHLIVDSSASMNYGGRTTKFDYASMLAVGYAYVAVRQNEKFQFATFDDGLHNFKPARGMQQVASMISHLNKVKPDGESRLASAITQYKRFIKSRSYIVIISDFLVPIEEIKKALPRLGDHEVHVIHVLDQKEVDLRFEGDLRLHDMETKGVLKTFISPKLRRTYQQKMSEHILNVEEACDQFGFNYHLATTSKPIFDTFYELLK